MGKGRSSKFSTSDLEFETREINKPERDRKEYIGCDNFLDNTVCITNCTEPDCSRKPLSHGDRNINRNNTDIKDTSNCSDSNNIDIYHESNYESEELKRKKQLSHLKKKINNELDEFYDNYPGIIDKFKPEALALKRKIEYQKKKYIHIKSQIRRSNNG